MGKDFGGEKLLHKEIRASAKPDKKGYMQEEIANGGWSAIKRLRKGRPKQGVNLRDESENLPRPATLWQRIKLKIAMIRKMESSRE